MGIKTNRRNETFHSDEIYRSKVISILLFQIKKELHFNK